MSCCSTAVLSHVSIYNDFITLIMSKTPLPTSCRACPRDQRCRDARDQCKGKLESTVPALYSPVPSLEEHWTTPPILGIEELANSKQGT